MILPEYTVSTVLMGAKGQSARYPKMEGSWAKALGRIVSAPATKQLNDNILSNFSFLL